MKRKLLIAAIILLVVFFIALFVYRFKFEFNNDKVKALLQEEADQYNNNSAAVYKILHESVQHILKSSDLTAQVRAYAKQTGLPKEKVLVDTAIANARALKYIS